MILRNVENNKGEYYTNEMYKKAERELKKYEDEKWQANFKIREKEFKVIKEKIVKKISTKVRRRKRKSLKTT